MAFTGSQKAAGGDINKKNIIVPPRQSPLAFRHIACIFAPEYPKEVFMKVLILAFLAMSINPLHAAEFTLNSGNYGESNNYYPEYGQKPEFHVQMSGSKLQVTDNANKLTYEVDTASSDEQLLQPKLLEHLRKLPGARTIANMIDRITVSDLIVDTAGVLHGNFYLYIKTTSVFGSVQAKIRIGAQVKNTSCKITRHDGYEQQGNNYTEKKLVYDGSCISAELGDGFALDSLQATNAVGGKAFAPEIINAIGLTADMVFKFYSPVMTGLITIYEQR
jgi:hypothetical protein